MSSRVTTEIAALLSQAEREGTGQLRASIGYRVPFYDTDAMGIVHHSNYLRYLELARVRFIEEFDQPYEAYVDLGLSIAVSECSVSYRRPLRFNDQVTISAELSWLKLVSLGFRYTVEANGSIAATAATEHALVDEQGRLRRLPAATLDRLLSALTRRQASPPAHSQESPSAHSQESPSAHSQESPSAHSQESPLRVRWDLNDKPSLSETGPRAR